MIGEIDIGRIRRTTTPQPKLQGHRQSIRLSSQRTELGIVSLY